MQVIHGRGFNDLEKREYVTDIHKNIIDAMDILVTQCKALNIGLRTAESESAEQTFVSSDDTGEKLATARILWADNGIQECFTRRSEYETRHPLTTSTKYFMDKLSTILETSYMPISDDIVRVRKKTEGVIQYEFVVTDIQFRIIDVGGERAEREKWINFLQSRITCVIFLGAIDEYNTNFIECEESEREKNKLLEAIELFGTIQNYSWLEHTTFILFLNKIDIFEEKIRIYNIIDHFPDFPGFPRDAENGKRFIRRLFLEQNSNNGNNRMVYTHETCATNTEDMRFVFEAVKDTILQLNLRQYNLV